MDSEHQYEISIVTMTKDDHSYLTEWIDYHKLIGVQHFYIYDNNTSDETKKVLDPYIKKKIVELIHWPDLTCYGVTQIGAFSNALRKIHGKTKWVSFLDTDEFIVPTKYLTLKETLEKEYAHKPLIYVNWKMFGTSFIFLPPPTLLLPSLLKCADRKHADNKKGKMIVRPEYLLAEIRNVHISPGLVGYVDGSGNSYPYTTHEEVWDNLINMDINDEFLRINHYTFRDEWFLQNVKSERLNLFQRSLEIEHELNAKYYNQEEDNRILAIIAESKKDIMTQHLVRLKL